MSYRIEYGPEVPPQYQKSRSFLRLQIMTAACLLLFVLLTKHFYPAGTVKLQQLLLPGEPTVTQQALESLVTDMRQGESFDDAFTAFCEQIIAHDPALSD